MASVKDEKEAARAETKKPTRWPTRLAKALFIITCFGSYFLDAVTYINCLLDYTYHVTWSPQSLDPQTPYLEETLDEFTA
jgi:hypothetical protein